jgi:hypothetical protein
MFQTQSQSRITLENGALVVVTPYKPDLVAAIKGLPYSDRKWDPARRAWLVDPKHGHTLTVWFAAYLGEDIQLPRITANAARKETRLLEVRYIGSTKERGEAERTAFGLVDDKWNAIFTETVLRTWFEAGPAAPDQQATLYSVLGLAQTCEPADIRSAFRRMARQWHPDVCKEPDATTVFQRINHANEILSDSIKRAKYDAGLALEASMGKQQSSISAKDYADILTNGYRAPLRCGFIMADGVEKMGRFVVEKIYAWEDITSGGLTLVVSWPMGMDKPVEQWV